jgi:sulfur carrier protein
VKVRVNGSEVSLDADATALDAARATGVEPDRRGVAVAVDGEVIPRGELDRMRLSEGQSVEIVAAIQGGSE